MQNDFTNEQIFFICNDFERALGLEKLLPGYHIVCIDRNSALKALKNKDVKVFCLEEFLGQENPIFRNSNKLLNEKEIQEYISQESLNSQANVIFFKIAPNIESTCEKLGYKILNTSAELNHAFELKLSQFENLKDKEVNFPLTVIKELGATTYDELSGLLGPDFVIQYDRGHTGSSTVFVNNEQDFLNEQKLFPKRFARISKKIEGDAWTLNACVTRFGIAYGGLCYQITGVEECTTKKGGTVGNDWTKTEVLSQEVIERIEKITLNAGNAMKEAGFKGLFGLDLIIAPNGEVFLIEINARQPASTGMHTKLLLEQGLIPLQAFHIAEFLYQDTEKYLNWLNHFFNKNLTELNASQFITDQNTVAIKPINAAQIIIRNTKSEDLIINTSFESGIYSLENNVLEKVREGYSVDNIENPESEMMILVPANGRIISPELEIARIQVKKSILDDNMLPENRVIESIKVIKKLLGV